MKPRKYAQNYPPAKGVALEKAARVQIPQSAYKSPCLRDFLTFARAFLSPTIS